MKIGTLRAIAHNVADSLGSGIGMLAAVYDIDIFAEAKKSSGGIITVDFLAAKATRGKVSPALMGAIVKYHKALPDLCGKHGASIEDFKTLTASYSASPISRRIVVRIRDSIGRRCMDEYVGTPARHVKVTDRLGRIRTRRRGSRTLKVVG